MPIIPFGQFVLNMFSKIIYLDGVACMGKKTLLRKLDSELYSVKLFDYADFKAFMSRTQIHTEKENTYSMWHTPDIDRGFVNRSPYSAKLYKLVYELLDNNTIKPDGFDERLHAIQASHMTVIFLPTNEESYPHIVEKMKRRANGIDRINIEYVRAQTIVFTEYARFNNLLIVYIDFTSKEKLKQFHNLYKLMCALIK